MFLEATKVHVAQRMQQGDHAALSIIDLKGVLHPSADRLGASVEVYLHMQFRGRQLRHAGSRESAAKGSPAKDCDTALLR